MTRAIIKIDIDQIVEIEGHHSEVEVSMGRIIGEDHNMSISMEMTLGETILEKCKIIEVKILEVDKEVIKEMTTSEKVEVGLGKDNIQIILERMTETVAVGLDQVQESVLTKIELDVLSAGNMIILLKTVQIHKQNKNCIKYNKCII